MKKIDRRTFLGTGAAAAATVTVGKSFGNTERDSLIPLKNNNEDPFNPVTYNAMPTRSFGKTGYKVGILSLGGQATLEIPGREAESEKIINRAIDLGINYIDTAASYGKGVSQLNIGRVMKTRRSEVWLSTKTHDRTYDGSMRLLEESLRNLQTDHLDLWQLHNIQRQDQVDQIFGTDGAIKAMEKAKSEGIVRYLGITGHFEPLVLLEAIKRYPFDSILLAVNAADVHYLSFKNYLLPEAQKRGIAIVGMKVTTRSRLLSSWTPPPPDQQTDERLRTQKPGTISIREALTYNMSLPVSTTIIGVDSLAQIEENVRIASEFTPLSQSQLEEIELKTLPVVRQALYFRRWDLGA
ncbi:MAG: aldo/keto reductase [Bacteroidales bacterium]|jgi:aryl-alcohol dehydrogenase-like predicted oxidoreductase|nr:aldo/keto reductase [Bacteroidales bacterium]